MSCFDHLKNMSRSPRRISICALAILLPLLLLFTALPAAQAQASTILYASPNGVSSGSCSAWATSCTLSYAIQIATSGSQIWVQAGVYTPGSNRGDAFRLKNGVAMYGGFQGSETRLAARNWKEFPSILSGDLLGNDQPDGTNRNDNAYHVVIAEDVSLTALLDGFSITAGNASVTGISYEGQGGGVHILNASPTLQNLTLVSNTAVRGGGLSIQRVKSLEESAVLQNIVVSQNTAERGGGIYCSGDSPNLYNLLFLQNRAQNGGGVTSESGCIAKLYNVAFMGNIAELGGAASAKSGSLVMTNNSINGNYASLLGGGIYKEDGAMIIANSILWGNEQANELNQISEKSPVNTFTNTNIIQGGYPGTNNLDVNPLFVKPTTRGPDGQWGTADDQIGILQLRYESPAIDIGDIGQYPINEVPRDLRNWRRVIDHPRPGTPSGQVIDLGAYEAGIIHVKKGVTGSADGSAWETAFQELSTALEFAQSGDELWVAAGTYVPGNLRTMSFQLKTELSIYGGFTGVETQRSERSLLDNPTILSGDIGAPNVTEDNSYHVVVGVGLIAGNVLDGFTIQSGNANGAGAGQKQGGGLYLENSSAAVFSNLIFQNNQAEQGGGAYSSQSAAVFENITFMQNQAKAGAGLYELNSSLTLGQLAFRGNQASEQGGGLYGSGSTSTATHISFQHNRATAGAGAYYSGGSPTLINVFFLGNLAESGQGGGMYNKDSRPDLSNVLFAGNKALQAGGMYNTGSAPILRNLTMIGNEGGALAFFASPANPAPTLANAIIWNNSARPIVLNNSKPEIYNSLLEGGCPSQANCQLVRSTNPLLIRLPNKGQDGVWGTADDDFGDARLLPNSPAIDSGNNQYIAMAVTTDLSGQQRLFDDPTIDDTGVGTAPIIDMGAYERRLAHSTTRIVSVVPAPSTVGQAVIVSFAVTGETGTPSGQVTISDGNISCEAAVSEGECSLVFETGGQKRLKASYSGDAFYDPSTSDEFLHTVQRIATTIVFSIEGGSQSVPGQPVLARYSVLPASVYTPAPGGWVTISSGTVLCREEVSKGACLLEFPEAGQYTITAVYEGDLVYQNSVSAAINHRVVQLMYLPLILR